MSVRANVLAAIITSTAGLVLALILLEEPIVEVRQAAYARGDLTQAAELVHRALDAGAGADASADRIGAEQGCHIVIFDPGSGEIRGDTARDGAMLGKVSEAMRTRAQSHDPQFYLDGEEHPSYRVVLVQNGIAVEARRRLATASASRGSIRELILSAGMLAVLLSILLSYVLSRSFVRPLEQLTRTADQLSEGDLSARSRLQRKDELGTLSRSLDKMANHLDNQLRAVQAEEERLRTILDSMVEAVFVTDPSGRISLTNPALNRLVAREEVIGRKVADVIANREIRDAVSKARRGKRSEVELTIEAGAPDEERVLSAHVTPLQANGGVVCVLHDVTTLKRADKIRRDFVANASHELRTPLTAIRGFAETLADGVTDSPTADRFLEAILRHTNRLQRLVDDLLALTRAESGDQTFELGPVKVGPMARDIVQGLEAMGQRKQLEMELDGVDDLPEVEANAWALDHVLVNLVDNAVKYTPEDGKIRVSGAVDDAWVVIEVTDTGPGIAKKAQSRIFERFYRVDKGRTRDQGGTGLGLAIVKHLVQRMGGEIEVESTLGTGTVFRVRLPLAYPEVPSIAS
ncbi:MAG: ATP-binding protein [Myxococcota bacterium]